MSVRAQKFLYQSTDLPDVDRPALKSEMLSLLREHKGASLYERLCGELGWAVDASLLSELRAAVASELAAADAALTEAEASQGEVEVRDALCARSEILARSGDASGAAEARARALARTAGSGPKLDLEFTALRASVAAGDWAGLGRGLARARALAASGGDWERRNRLKVYEALFAMAQRRAKEAASLLLDAIATFTATELLAYADVAAYAVLYAVAALPRPELAARVADAPEILAVLDAQPDLKALLHALRACDYRAYARALDAVADSRIRRDRYLRPHLRFLVLELRVAALAQFLEAYRSVTLQAAAHAFGLSEAFLERELADLIRRGRLAAKIDAVERVVLTTRPDPTTKRYEETIKVGDALLNKIQILAKIIDAE